jgi:hypothetical protein
MFVNRSTAFATINNIVNAATAKAGNANRLARVCGVNPATLWRIRESKGSLSAQCLLSIIMYLGWPDTIDIVTSQVRGGTVGDFIDDRGNGLSDMRSRATQDHDPNTP